ncbi:replicative DNA helicase [Actinomadura terrae]|uniref:replicative DNA helicase n=1 Tax=Actinomadura terrae TaxID=604353 RepID=UPI001FA7CB8C|nr:replicative DNA helicase [Actinomadura terrae]
MSVSELGPHEHEFERTPPNDITAEQGVLGGMLLSQDAIAEVVEVLRSGDFYRPAHQIVYDTILDLYGRGDPADAVTVAGELTKNGDIGRIGGAPYLHTLISLVPTAANAGYYAKIVHERSVLRKLVETGTRIVQMGYAADGADADEVLDRAQAEVFAIAEKRSGEDYVPLSEIMPGALDEIEAIGSRGGQMVGCPTGFADLDALTNGLHPGQMVVVAARPAMGKALALPTPLPTPTGWTTMGEVAVGDHLLGADGRPTRVVAATEVMHDRPCYEVEFSDGEVIIADAHHQWRTTTAPVEPAPSRRMRTQDRLRPTRARAGSARLRFLEAWSRIPSVVAGTGPGRTGVDTHDRLLKCHAATAASSSCGGSGGLDFGLVVDSSGSGTRTPLGLDAPRKSPSHDPAMPYASFFGVTRTSTIRTTEELAATLRCADGGPRHAVEVAAPFDLPDADLPVAPYVLGAWLAGSGEGESFTCANAEVLEEIAAAGQHVKPTGTPGRYALPGLAAKLAKLGLGRDKHIPDAYLRASEPQRRALFAGMLDTAGHISHTGQVRLPVVGRHLAEAAHELVLTLGHRATLTPTAPAVPATGTFAEPVAERLADAAAGRPAELAAGRLAEVAAGRFADPGAESFADAVAGRPVEAATGRPAKPLAGPSNEPVVEHLVDAAAGSFAEAGAGRLAKVAAGRFGGKALVGEARLGVEPPAGPIAHHTGGPIGERPAEVSYEIAFTPAGQVFRRVEGGRVAASPATRVRHIVDIRPVESVPVRCVQVDNDDHMYLAGRSCVPTHNSTLALDFARAASIKHGLTSAFFSLEMGRNEITMRLLSAEARVALHAMRSGTMQDEDWTRLARRMSEVAEAPLFIDDSPNMSMMEIRAKCRRLKQQHDLRLVIIDYLQLMSSGKRVESRQVEVSEFSRSLKLLAKELGVPVIALSQLNRGPEQRTDKKPMVSDLRESGSIEQDADMVILLHREDAYEKESPRAGEADLIVAKHRNGPTATVTVAFQGHYSRFVDMAQ